MNFEGQTVVVTGAGGGIGRAIAVAFAKEGANVVIHYAHNRDAAEETKRACEQAKGAADSRFLLVQADIAEQDQVNQLFLEALAISGRVDALVCNAGITKDSLLLTLKPEDFDKVVRTNLYGTFYCMKQASKIMLKQRYGRIITLSSIVGIHGNAGQVSYAASKAGIIGMTKSLAQELAKRNITVNAVAPGMIDTEMTRSLPDSARENMLVRIPAGRAGRPEEVADAVVFLARKSSGYITAQVLGVDGGMGA